MATLYIQPIRHHSSDGTADFDEPWLQHLRKEDIVNPQELVATDSPCNCPCEHTNYTPEFGQARLDHESGQISGGQSSQKVTQAKPQPPMPQSWHQRSRQSSSNHHSLFKIDIEPPIAKSTNVGKDTDTASQNCTKCPLRLSNPLTLTHSREEISKRASSTLLSPLLSWIKPHRMNVGTIAALIVLGITIPSFILSRWQTDIAEKSYRLGIYKDCHDRPVSFVTRTSGMSF